jgi:cell division protein FtsB
MRRAVRLLIVAVVGMALVLLFVLPGRTMLAQHHSLSVAERQLTALNVENAKLRQEAKALQSTADIERIAREDYGLVVPGQQAYAVIPATANSATTTTTTTVGVAPTMTVAAPTTASPTTTLAGPAG